MPRYFFHLHNDMNAPDEEGLELLDLEAARMVALQRAQFAVAKSTQERGHFSPDHRIDIGDENGETLDTVYFRDAAKFKG